MRKPNKALSLRDHVRTAIELRKVEAEIAQENNKENGLNQMKEMVEKGRKVRHFDTAPER